MAFLSKHEREFLEAVSQLAYANPFLPERTEYERAALGDDFVRGEPVWSRGVEEPERPRENVWRIFARLEQVIEGIRQRLEPATRAPQQELVLYEDGLLH